ncbi:MAG TPA: hypothetical protein VG222_19975 [Vicinamibacterales bacterium]|jgi:hypothetical protein|nr:hypothetical protein [Vicinamibacterales bacterium]
MTFVLLPLALLAAGCGSSNSTTTPTTSGHTVQTFNGTLQPSGSDTYDFTTGISGEVTVTLTNAGPPSNVTLGLGVGTPNGSACTLILAQSVTAANIAQIASSADPGSYCISVFDAGSLTAPVNYTVVLSHF